jgi:hypothetical protein
MLRVRSTGSAEYNIIESVRNFPIFPLLEITRSSAFQDFSDRLHKSFGTIMVDVPRYLLHRNNRYRRDLRALLGMHQNDPVNFHNSVTSKADIPVVSLSARIVAVQDYTPMVDMINHLAGKFGTIAVRVTVPQSDIRSLARSNASYSNLLQHLPAHSVILFDVPVMTAYEQVVARNLREMRARIVSGDHKVYVLNAFGPIANGHNFGPYFTLDNGLDGFGDFATEERFPPASGGRNRATTSIIRYYNYERYTIEEFRRSSYRDAENDLKASSVWQRQPSHRTNCRACLEVQNGNSGGSHSYWKAFRMIHYVTATMNETRNSCRSAASAQVLDPDGHRAIGTVSPGP